MWAVEECPESTSQRLVKSVQTRVSLRKVHVAQVTNNWSQVILRSAARYVFMVQVYRNIERVSEVGKTVVTEEEMSAHKRRLTTIQYFDKCLYHGPYTNKTQPIQT